MIKRIDRLQNFGIYRDFTGDSSSELPEFKKLNIIYGWNYSGKTTVSRLFQALEFPDKEVPYADSHFSVSHSDDSTTTEASRTCPYCVRVFNSDFIDANFQAEHTAPAVFIVGEESITLRNRLNALRAAQASMVERRSEYQQQRAEIQGAVNTAATDGATVVRELLGVTNFRRPDMIRRINEVKGAPESFLLTEEARQTHIETFRSGDQFAPIHWTQQQLPDLAGAIDPIRTLLQRTAANDAIAGLAGNPDLESWLRVGLGLHTDGGTCQFCESPIPEGRLDTLGRHFSEASQQLLTEVDKAIRWLRDIQFTAPRIDPMQFIQSLREDVRAKMEELEDWLAAASTLRDALVVSLEAKRTSLEAPLPLAVAELDLNAGPAHLASLSQYVTQHNESIGNMANLKTQARVAIERHYAAYVVIEHNLVDKEEEIIRLVKHVRLCDKAIARLRVAAEALAGQVNRAGRGAERFMELVAFLLKGSDIRVESHGEVEFQLKRGDHLADRMSDGEKTAIAFAYFITSLEADGEDLENTVVYIDDPISSLDSNHVYAIYSLVTNRLKEAKQLFVSTHNSEFFGLLKGAWLGQGACALYVRRSSDDDGSYAQLEELPKLLRKYKSEYEFIFAQLYAFSSATTPTEHEAYTAPNLLRRFLEAYLGFRKPCVSAWHQKLDLILDDENEREEIHKLLDDASHLQHRGRALQLPDYISSSQSCVRRVLTGLEAKDKSHYDSLVSVVTATA